MSGRKRSSPKGADRREQWLRSERHRSRPWAYEELLFGPIEDRERSWILGALEADLASERDNLSTLRRHMDQHLTRIATLEGRLNALASGGNGEPCGAIVTHSPRSRADRSTGARHLKTATVDPEAMRVSDALVRPPCRTPSATAVSR